MNPLFARRSGYLPTDWALGGLGLTMATASASFAGYMIVTAPAQVTGYGSKEFTVFAQFDRRGSGAAAARAPADERTVAEAPVPGAVSAPAAPSPARPPARVAAIDPDPTGSIPVGGTAHREPLDVPPSPLHEFRLRDVVGDHALIEHRDRLSVVRQGSVLPGAGEVLSIERQGRGWVVRTVGGVIGGGSGG